MCPVGMRVEPNAETHVGLRFSRQSKNRTKLFRETQMKSDVVDGLHESIEKKELT